MIQENLVKQFLGAVEANGDRFPQVAEKVKRLIHTGKWDALSEYTRDLSFPTPIPASDLRAVIDPGGTITPLVAFKNRLIDDPVLRAKLESLADGDWEGIARIAALEGLSITVDELKQNISVGFFKGHGQNANVGWEASSV